MTYRLIRVEPVSPHVGAEISGVDLVRPITADAFTEIRRAFGRYGVVFFRDQDLTPEQHVAFAERFAPIDINRFFTAVPGYPMIAEVRKEPEQTRNIGGGWHTDHSYDQVPALGSMLYAREVPQTGGDTLFASMYSAYDALSDGLKQTLDGLRACHSSRHVFGADGRARQGDLAGRIGHPELATQDAVHPVVIRHPETGYVNPGLRCVSTAGPRKNCGRYCSISTNTRCGRNSPAASTGARVHSRCGTTARPGTSRSTTTTASVASCTASQSRAHRFISRLPQCSIGLAVPPARQSDGGV
jgi:taurine dioxygenase